MCIDLTHWLVYCVVGAWWIGHLDNTYSVATVQDRLIQLVAGWLLDRTDAAELSAKSVTPEHAANIRQNVADAVARLPKLTTGQQTTQTVFQKEVLSQSPYVTLRGKRFSVHAPEWILTTCTLLLCQTLLQIVQCGPGTYLKHPTCQRPHAWL